MSKLNISDLLASLSKPTTDNAVPSLPVPKFADTVVKDTNKKIKVLSRKQEQAMKRQSNYDMAKEEMDKWVGIIKVNREKESLNFEQKDIGNLNVNFFPAQPINDFHKKLEDKLEGMNVQNQKSVLKHEDKVLEKVDPEEAKLRLIEARKHRTAVFYEEQKRRRIAKIKSKLYHKIKKRQKQREELKNIEKMNPAEKNDYIEKLTKQRIKERITLRHNTKNKHIQNLLRFNRSEKNSIQTAINEINDIRHQKMEKLNQQEIEEMSDEYDDDNFREEALKDLEAQIQAIEAGEPEEMEDEVDKKLKDLKFIKNAKEKRQQKDKEDAIRIFNKLAKGKDLKEKDVNSDMEDEQDEDQQQSQQSEKPANSQRKQYGAKLVNEEDKRHKNQSEDLEKKLRNYLLSGDGGKESGEKEKKNELLIKGINVDNLKNKYQPDRVPIDLTSLIANNQDIYNNYENEAVLENVREFQEQKIAEIEELVQQKQSSKKVMKGWGSWAGPGISQKKVDPQQELRKKLKAIEEIKQKRKDNSLANITITEQRNKKLSEYMVKDLPHNFSNADQFDFMQSEPIGPEWNSLTQFGSNIKPKVIAKAGQVIKPINLPKSMVGKKKN